METPQESLFEFPCQFPIKVMGKDRAGMLAVLREVLAEHAPDTSLADVQVRPSRSGRFVGLTIVIEAQSKAQLDRIYLALTASQHIMVAL